MSVCWLPNRFVHTLAGLAEEAARHIYLALPKGLMSGRWEKVHCNKMMGCMHDNAGSY